MGGSQPTGRVVYSRYDDGYHQETIRNSGPIREQKPIEVEHDYGDYDNSYKDAYRQKTYNQAPPVSKFVICDICGRKYGSQSIEIHERQCMEKWHIDNSKLPANQRRPPPRKSDIQSGHPGDYTLNDINNVAYETSKSQLIPCEYCGRTFAHDRIQAHQRGCKPNYTSKSNAQAMVQNPPRGSERYNQQQQVIQRGNYGHREDEYDDTEIHSSIKGGTPVNSYPTNGNNKLYPCAICNRSFTNDRIRQHEEACRKAHKQRRIFDSTKQRLEGTEAASFYRKNKLGKGRLESNKTQLPKSNWRQKHEDFIQAIRYAKQASSYEKNGGRLADLRPPPPTINSDYVQCPHCGRNYAPGVAERHIPKCVNIQNKPRPPPPASVRMGAPQRVPVGVTTGGNHGRAPVSNYASSSGGFSNGNRYGPPSNRPNRAGYRN